MRIPLLLFVVLGVLGLACDSPDQLLEGEYIRLISPGYVGESLRFNSDSTVVRTEWSDVEVEDHPSAFYLGESGLFNLNDNDLQISFDTVEFDSTMLKESDVTFSDEELNSWAIQTLRQSQQLRSHYLVRSIQGHTVLVRPEDLNALGRCQNFLNSAEDENTDAGVAGGLQSRAERVKSCGRVFLPPELVID